MTDDSSFVGHARDNARPDWMPPARRQPDALDLISAVNDDGELTIMPAMGETKTEWITSDTYEEVGR